MNKEERHSKIIQNFTEAATDFCNLLDNIPKYSKEDFIYELSVSLVRLYLHGLELPVLPDEFYDYPEFSVIHKYRSDHGNVIDDINTLFEKKENEFLFVFHPYPETEKDKEPNIATFWDGLSDIYADVKKFLYLKEDKKLFRAALCMLIIDFDHWGRHAAELFLPLHKLEYKYRNKREEKLLKQK